jgi:hypothetical protein
VCRTWFCGWRCIESLDDSWRPDRSGILIEEETNKLPWNYKKRKGVKFTIIGEHKAVLWSDFINYVTSLIERGVPVFLSAGQKGHAYGRTFLNDVMMPSVLARDVHRISNDIVAALESCVKHPGEKITIGDVE